MGVSVRELERDDLRACVDALVPIHRAAFTQWPHDIPGEELARFAADTRESSELPGFRCVVAFDRATQLPVGFAYGWTSRPGPDWRNVVEKALGPRAAQEWLSDTLELALIGVHPDRQGQGIGARVHDALLRRAPHARAVLSTLQEESRALALFRRRGWQTLLRDLRFRPGGRRFLIMGQTAGRWA